jgi:filamentous hemagglutinin
MDEPGLEKPTIDPIDLALGVGAIARVAIGRYVVRQALGKALLNANPIGNALKDDLYHRAASWIRQEAAEAGSHFQIVGGDGTSRTLTQILGRLNELPGRFEYIVDQAGNLVHQRFVPNGVINGIPNIP